MEELNELRQWVCWRNEVRGGKPTKVPYRRDGKPASSTEPATWDWYENVLAAGANFSGIGFVFSPDDPYLGIDFDACLVDGVLAAWAKPWVEKLASYTEVSPSGTGVKVWVKAKLPDRCKHKFIVGGGVDGKEAAIEVYDQKRYFAVTEQLFGDHTEIRDAQAVVDEMLLFFGLTAPQREPAKQQQKRTAKQDDWGDYEFAEWYLSRLSYWRADDYNMWISVGCCLKAVPGGDALWEAWSQQSQKYTAGDCARRWQGLVEDTHGLAKLGDWANADSPHTKKAKPKALPPSKPPEATGATETNESPQCEASDGLLADLAKIGYEAFSEGFLGEIKCRYLGNTVLLSDAHMKSIRWQMRAAGYGEKGKDPRRTLQAIEEGIAHYAMLNKSNPVADYFNSLTVWDGTDYIAKLAAHIKCQNIIEYDNGTRTLAHVFLRRWLIGTVGKALAQEQSVMLVLAGPQHIGKSTFARWLCPIKELFIEGPIKPDDKDSFIRLASRLVWEVSELDGTTRKADVSALKDFITKREITVRRSYGHFDMTVPALASMIGTVNPGTGFLVDTSGNRRFMIVDVTAIDRGYQEIPLDMVWAQALHLFRKGESTLPTIEEREAQESVNREHEVQTPLTDWLLSFCEISHDEEDFMTAGEILDLLNKDQKRVDSSVVRSGELKRALAHLGIGEPKNKKQHGKNYRAYVGIRAK